MTAIALIKKIFGLSYSKSIKRRIFICGCGHSGTTILLAILSRHSEIFGIGNETACFISKNSIRKYIKHKTRIQKYIEYEALAIKHNKYILLEKTPRHIYKIEHMLKCVPDSKVILMIRNPLDVVASLNKRYDDLDRSLARYLNDYQAALPWLDHENILKIKYEELVAAPQEKISEICSFIKAPYEDGMLNYHQSQSMRFNGVTAQAYTDGKEGPAHDALRNWQIRQPISNRSGEWKKRLSVEECELIRAKTHDLAKALGYSFTEPYMDPENVFIDSWNA